MSCHVIPLLERCSWHDAGKPLGSDMEFFESTVSAEVGIHTLFTVFLYIVLDKSTR